MTSARCRFEELCCCRDDSYSLKILIGSGPSPLVTRRAAMSAVLMTMMPLSVVLALEAIILGFKIKVLYQTFWRCLFNTG